MKRALCTCGNRKMHNQDIRSLCELNEFGVGTGLIGAEYYRDVPCSHPVRQSREIAVRYPQGGNSYSLPVEHCRCFGFRHINDTDIETNASARFVLGATQCGTEHLKRAVLLIEEATEEGRKGWCRVVAGRPDIGSVSLRIWWLNQRMAGKSET